MRTVVTMNLALVLLAVLLAVALSSPAPAATEESPVTGPAVAGLESFDKMMQGFLAEHHGVGASLAVTRKGKLGRAQQ
jgi:hypothetical protein